MALGPFLQFQQLPILLSILQVVIKSGTGTQGDLCWGFTAQSTQWGHVERSQFT